MKPTITQVTFTVEAFEKDVPKILEDLKRSFVEINKSNKEE